MRSPDVAAIGVVVVNWNGTADTIGCLESLRVAVPPPARVIVVDNASHDDSVTRLEEWRARHAAEWLTILVANENRGFSGGNNVGLARLRADDTVTHYLLLNNDATVTPEYFARLCDALIVCPDAGLMTGTTFEDPARDKVWYAGGREIPGRALVAHLYDVPQSSAPRDTDFVSGCTMLISRELADTIGLLPECYFPLYSEDAEYSHRARRAGFKVLYAPAAIAYHKVGATVGHAATSPRITRVQMRHRALYVRRNFDGAQRIAALAYLAITKPGKAVVEALRGRPRMGWATLAGTVEGFFAAAGRERATRERYQP